MSKGNAFDKIKKKTIALNTNIENKSLLLNTFERWDIIILHLLVSPFTKDIDDLNWNWSLYSKYWGKDSRTVLPFLLGVVTNTSKHRGEGSNVAKEVTL